MVVEYFSGYLRRGCNDGIALHCQTRSASPRARRAVRRVGAPGCVGAANLRLLLARGLGQERSGTSPPTAPAKAATRDAMVPPDWPPSISSGIRSGTRSTSRRSHRGGDRDRKSRAYGAARNTTPASPSCGPVALFVIVRLRSINSLILALMPSPSSARACSPASSPSAALDRFVAKLLYEAIEDIDEGQSRRCADRRHPGAGQA